jgi:hypothetical protein
VGEIEGRRPLGRPRRNWEDLREIEWTGIIYLKIKSDGRLL